jgi:hypothetical protein
MNTTRIEKIKKFLQTLPAGSFGTHEFWKGISKDFRALGLGTRLNGRQESVTFHGLCHAAQVSGVKDGYGLVAKIGKVLGLATGWYFWPKVENKSRRRAALALDIAEAVRQLREEKWPAVDKIKEIARGYQGRNLSVGTAEIWENIAKEYAAYNPEEDKNIVRCGLCYAGSKSGIGSVCYNFVADIQHVLVLPGWPRDCIGAVQRVIYAKQIAQALREIEQGI